MKHWETDWAVSSGKLTQNLIVDIGTFAWRPQATNYLLTAMQANTPYPGSVNDSECQWRVSLDKSPRNKLMEDKRYSINRKPPWGASRLRPLFFSTSPSANPPCSTFVRSRAQCKRRRRGLVINKRGRRRRRMVRRNGDRRTCGNVIRKSYLQEL